MTRASQESQDQHSRRDHVPELDGQRGTAVLLVLWVHLPRYALGDTLAAARDVFLPGNVGVDLFFVP